MDKIWDRKSFEVGGHWPLWRGRKKRITMQNRQKLNAYFFFFNIGPRCNGVAVYRFIEI